MLLELAIGDAYGAPFEYADRLFIERFNDGANIGFKDIRKFEGWRKEA